MVHYAFHLPDIGEGVAEAEIVAWHIKVGDRIGEDQPMVDVMTDKATVDMTSPVAGIVTAVHGDIGQLVPVGSVLVELDIEPAQTPLTKAAAPSGQAPSAAPARAGSPTDREPLAAPATRRRAKELGIDLNTVSGTGPEGRITAEDLNAYVARASAGSSSRTGFAEIRLVGLRRKIAEKMQESKRRIPHFGYVEEFDLTALEALRVSLNDKRRADRPKLTLLAFFMRAVVQLIPAFPYINARYDEDAGILRTYEAVHIGIATQTPDGLMVPVVRHAEARSLWDGAAELARVTAAARAGSATLEELTGSTITLTSLGTLGGIAATPIINHPEVAIIGPNKLIERPVVVADQIVIRLMMNVSSSFDHRIVDGYDAARFIQGLKQLIEQPTWAEREA